MRKGILGGRDETFYDREVDRFYKPGRGCQRESVDGETPGARLQTLHGNSFTLAESPSLGGCGRKLSASGGQRPACEGGFRRRRFEGSKKGNGQPDQGPLRHFSAARFRRSPIRWRRHKANALSRGSFSDRCPPGSKAWQQPYHG